MKNIMVMDEDNRERITVGDSLKKIGYRIFLCEQVDDDLGRFKNQKIDLVIVANSIYLSQFNIEYIKDRLKCPIIVILDGDCENAICQCLAYSADDIVLKPIREKELISKVKYYSDRNKERNEMIAGAEFIEDEVSICINDQKIKFTKKEFTICKYLARNSSNIMSKEVIFDIIYDFDVDTQTRTITEYIYSIRNKFKCVNVNPIKTVWGTGYKWTLS